MHSHPALAYSHPAYRTGFEQTIGTQERGLI